MSEVPGKIIHVTPEAHTAAKSFCKEHRKRMSEWVSELITREVNRASPVTQGKILERLSDDEDSAIYRRPPFWAKA